MKEFIAANQLNWMLIMGSICGMTALFSYISESVTWKRKRAMIGMDLSAMILLFSDRYAYIFRGQTSGFATIMTRVSNYLVYSMTVAAIFFVNRYIEDLCLNEGGEKKVPICLHINDMCAILALILIIISQFTGLYYTFDEYNRYVRSPGFIICYIFPVIMSFFELRVLIRIRKHLNKSVLVPLMLFSVTPLVAGVIQVFCYGLSLTNLSMVGEIIIIYVFALMDTNKQLAKAHELEMDTLRKEKMSMNRLFDETSKAFVSAIERKDIFLQGHSVRIAEVAKRLAEMKGKSPEECYRVYYAALLHNIGLILLPDSIIGKKSELSDGEYKLMKKIPVFSSDILSSITEYPYLSKSARHSYERYDGKGYPDGLQGESIPEISRIIAVARAYDAMVSKRRFREALPIQVVREELLKGSGTQFDADYTELMVQVIDMENMESKAWGDREINKDIFCGKYRDNIGAGIPVTDSYTILRFKCRSTPEKGVPALILFDSYDRRVHVNRKTIDSNHYIEYGEIWLDGHIVSTEARNMEIYDPEEESTPPAEACETTEMSNEENIIAGEYELIFGRYDDHLKIDIKSKVKSFQVVTALPNKSMMAYIGLTGENCHIYDIELEHTSRKTEMGDIPRIAEEISYIDRIEADLPNLQVDRTRSSATEGIEVRDGLEIRFHSMSLPTAGLVWECPYIVLFYSEDKKVYGEGYQEYALIKLNGEIESSDEKADNRFVMQRTDEFVGWDQWKQRNKEGLIYDVEFLKKGNRITLLSENLGVDIQNTTYIKDYRKKVYAAITGDQVALTDIRVI